MATTNLDTNQWYQLCVGDKKDSCVIGTDLFSTSNTKGAVFISPGNASATVQRWQVFPVTVNKTAVYVLRSGDSGPNGFLGVGYSATEETEGMTRPMMYRGDVAGQNVFWSFGDWGDGTSFMANEVNGTSHLNVKSTGIMAMSPNITAPQNGQRFKLSPIAKIDDSRYSSVNLIAVASTSTPSSVSPPASPSVTSASITSSPTASSTSGMDANPSDESTSGLSTGAKAGIGAAVGVAILIALVILGLFLWKKRKQRVQYVRPEELGHNTPPIKYEMYHDTAAKHELHSTVVVEVPHNERPAELPGHMPAKRTWYP